MENRYQSGFLVNNKSRYMITTSKWGKLTAERYKYYATKYPMYKELSRLLVKIADIKKGMTIIDLACGTGVTTEEILKKIRSFGKVIGVDSSKEMLNIAKEKIKQKNVFFIYSSAEEMHKIIKEKADLVLCNSSFFIMNMDKTLQSIRKILKDQGRFIFNIPDQYYEFSEKSSKRLPFPVILKMMREFMFSTEIQSSEFPKRLKENLSFPVALKVIMQKIAVEKYGFKSKQGKELKLLNLETINNFFKNNSFRIDGFKVFGLKKTPRECYEFLKIPLMTEGMFPGLKYSERMEILDTAYEQIEKPREFINKWIYFVCKKFNRK